MRFIDDWQEPVITLRDLKAEWVVMHQQEPYNFADTFKEHLLNLILATINYRNDMEIIDMTPAEVQRFINGLRRRIYGKVHH